MVKAAVFASGNGSNFLAIIDACLQQEIPVEVVLLVCNNKEAYVIERAKQANIPVLLIDYNMYSNDEIEEVIKSKLIKLEVEYIFLAGFLKKLSADFISDYPQRIINIHPSLLPKYKGLNAIEKAINNGDTEIGVTVHYVNEFLDDGVIIIQDKIEIGSMKDAEVFNKVHELEHRLYIKAIKLILKGAK